MTTLTMPARRSQTDTWLLVLMLWHGLVAVAGAVAVYSTLTDMQGGMRFVVAGVIAALGVLSAAAVPLIHRRNHRGRVFSLVVNYLGFLACVAMLLLLHRRLYRHRRSGPALWPRAALSVDRLRSATW